LEKPVKIITFVFSVNINTIGVPVGQKPVKVRKYRSGPDNGCFVTRHFRIDLLHAFRRRKPLTAEDAETAEGKKEDGRIPGAGSRYDPNYHSAFSALSALKDAIIKLKDGKRTFSENRC
jgi:hypothetical protein